MEKKSGHLFKQENLDSQRGGGYHVARAPTLFYSVLLRMGNHKKTLRNLHLVPKQWKLRMIAIDNIRANKVLFQL